MLCWYIFCIWEIRLNIILRHLKKYKTRTPSDTSVYFMPIVIQWYTITATVCCECNWMHNKCQESVKWMQMECRVSYFVLIFDSNTIGEVFQHGTSKYLSSSSICLSMNLGVGPLWSYFFTVFVSMTKCLSIIKLWLLVSWSYLIGLSHYNELDNVCITWANLEELGGHVHNL